MMMLLFLLFSISMLLGWFGKKKLALAVFLIAIGLSAFWFKHHATDTLNIFL
jgi:hypothetical protein